MSPVRRAIVAFPRIESEPEWERGVAFRERPDPLARWVAPHVTLVFPFDDPVSNEALHGEVVDALQGVSPFRVVLRGITAHEGEYLFLNVKQGNDPIIELHDRLYRGVLASHRSRRHTFVPHITVGRVAPDDLAAALHASALLDARIVGTIDRVLVEEIAPTGASTIAFEVPLGGSPWRR